MIHRGVEHFIQRDILRTLSRSPSLSFSSLKSDGLDNSIFSYHLKQLMSVGLVDKKNNGYALSVDGVRYVARVTRTNLDLPPQPKLFSLLIIKNDSDEYILHRRGAQPFIGRYTFPGGALFFDEELEDHVERQLYEKVGSLVPLANRGMASLRLGENGHTLSHTYAHLFYGDVSGRPPLSAKDARFTPEWVKIEGTRASQVLPDVKIIIDKLATTSDYFFLDVRIDE